MTCWSVPAAAVAASAASSSRGRTARAASPSWVSPCRRASCRPTPRRLSWCWTWCSAHRRRRRQPSLRRRARRNEFRLQHHGRRAHPALYPRASLPAEAHSKRFPRLFHLFLERRRLPPRVLEKRRPPLPTGIRQTALDLRMRGCFVIWPCRTLTSHCSASQRLTLAKQEAGSQPRHFVSISDAPCQFEPNSQRRGKPGYYSH